MMTNIKWADVPSKTKDRVNKLPLSKTDKNRLRKQIVADRNSGKLSGRDLWLAKGIEIPAKKLKLTSKIKAGKKAESKPKVTKAKATKPKATTVKAKKTGEVTFTTPQMANIKRGVRPDKVDTLVKKLKTDIKAGKISKYDAMYTKKLGVYKQPYQSKKAKVEKAVAKAKKAVAKPKTTKPKSTTTRAPKATKASEVTFTEKIASKLRRGIKPDKVDTYFKKLKIALAKGDIVKRDLYKPSIIAKYKLPAYVSKQEKVKKVVAKAKKATTSKPKVKSTTKKSTTTKKKRKMPDSFQPAPTKAKAEKILKGAGLSKADVDMLGFAKGYLSKAYQAGKLTDDDMKAMVKRAEKAQKKPYKQRGAYISAEYHKRKKEASVRSRPSSRQSPKPRKPRQVQDKYKDIASTPSRVISEKKVDKKLEEIQKLSSSQVTTKLIKYGVDLSDKKTISTLQQLEKKERAILKDQGIRGSAKKRALQDLLIMLELEAKN